MWISCTCSIYNWSFNKSIKSMTGWFWGRGSRSSPSYQFFCWLFSWHIWLKQLMIHCCISNDPCRYIDTKHCWSTLVPASARDGRSGPCSTWPCTPEDSGAGQLEKKGTQGLQKKIKSTILSWSNCLNLYMILFEELFLYIGQTRHGKPIQVQGPQQKNKNIYTSLYDGTELFLPRSFVDHYRGEPSHI